ncbi:hypothetical protein [Paraburkholderia youngii]|uniref:hypothetical protein n=1 Tax=Paraburkholderia youngii TaxID=2782701 RepID=UPI001590E90B|nr:hypothetical protein [Paraburkholderia youngii]NUX59101.1 hypothetical protein [Paraburkholderia youngii]
MEVALENEQLAALPERCTSLFSDSTPKKRGQIHGEDGFKSDYFLQLAGQGVKEMLSWEYGLPRD